MTSRTMPAVAASVLTICVLTLTGCKGRELEKAQREARQAKVTIVKLESNLADAIQEISEMKAERDAFRQARDELQQRENQLIKDQEEASTLVQRAEEMIKQLTARANGQAGATAALEKQIADLKALVTEQEKIIEELQQGADAGRITAGTPDKLGLETTEDINDVTDANDVIEEVPPT